MSCSSSTPLKLACVVAAVAAAALAVPSPAAATSPADAVSCSLYPAFPVSLKTQRCFFVNACFEVQLCCPAGTTGGSGATLGGYIAGCLDTTNFYCDLVAPCQQFVSTGGGGTSQSPLYNVIGDEGGSVQCCSSEEKPETPQPSVPPLDGGYMVPITVEALQSGGSNDDDSDTAPQPVDPNCADPHACSPTLPFGLIIRTLCPDLPAAYDDGTVTLAMPSVCCYYTLPNSTANVNDTSANGRDWACGADLLDLPKTAQFHCNMVIRQAEYCCNGRVDEPATTATTAGPDDIAEVQRLARAIDVSAELADRANLVYTYGDSMCTGRIVKPDNNNGDGAAAAPGATVVAKALAAGLLAVALAISV